ncbi:MAG: class II fructose-bisphosphate aldolase [Nitrospirae bacterium]|nr:class II fructose-bisphosphate aldolase [Nitrospirota bacterium]
MGYKTMQEVVDSMKGIAEIKDNRVRVFNETSVRSDLIDKLVFNAVFNKDTELRNKIRWLIRALAHELGAGSASIQGLYDAMGRGEAGGFTVPAINIRGLTYDVARAVIRAAKKNNSGAFIFEIAKSEIGYTGQSPDEYAVVIIAAAVKEGYKGPLFIQGDHFQANAKKYQQDPAKEVAGLKDLIKEAIAAGFYNIDIDTSTLVDLSKPDIKEQQRLNFELAAELTAYIRQMEPKGVTISVGGEIGEVGGQNSTVGELRAFMNGYREALATRGKGGQNSTVGELRVFMNGYREVLAARGKHLQGISKISVQTGTTHGGVPLPDGTIAKVKLDFDTLEKMSTAARQEYGLSGAVQHGASTLPGDAFHRFPETGTAEVHLATGFQNMTYDSKIFPADFREDIYSHLREKCADEKKQGESDEQFIYKTRKKGFGPFKERFWTLPEPVKKTIGQELEEKLDFLFKKLNVVNTYATVTKYVKPAEEYPK